MDWRRWMERRSGDPQWWLRTVLGVAAALLVLWLVIVSRMEFGAQSTESVSPRIEAVRGGGGATAVEADSAQPTPAEQKKLSRSGKGPFVPAFTTFLVLISLLGGVWYLVVHRSGSSASPSRGSHIRSIALSAGSELSIVRINGEVWVLGVSPQGSVQLLHRYPEEEWIEPGPDATLSENGPSFWSRLRGEDA